MEEKIIFQADKYDIEGLLSYTNQNKGVVITHPHPLYGGDMYNYVVESLVNAYQKSGYATLRFNFRGVGKSQGTYDQGIGEQQDVLSAVSYLFSRGITQVDLAGYSFGVWVNAHINCKAVNITNMVMISPPVNLLNFDNIKVIENLKLVVCGDDDEFASKELVQKKVFEWNPKAYLEIIPDTDHFYGLSLRKVEQIVENHFRETQE